MVRKLLLLAVVAVAGSIHTGEDMTSFVVRVGNVLKLNGKTWRFAGMNMYWLGLDENCSPPKSGKCVDYPTAYRIRDGLETAVALGANVVRGHSLGVSSGNPKSLEFRRDVFNRDAFAPIDYAIFTARKLGLRLVVPLTDNYDYYHGGFWNFVKFEAGNCSWYPKHIPQTEDACRAFFDHAVPRGDAVIADFKLYVKTLLTHVNQYTGIALKDDPAILAWETGNELQISFPPFTNWTEEIAAYIKITIGAKQLVLDGRDEIGQGVDQTALDSTPHVDMYTDHFYEPARSAAMKVSNRTAAKEKVYYVGEYGPTDFSFADLDFFLETLRLSSTVTGDTWWSFFPHGDSYGFVPHGDSYTLHYPGDTFEKQTTLLALRDHAFQMRGLPVPNDTDAPGVPVITYATGDALIAWRGATLAVSYDVERSDTAGGPWKKVCDRCATDHDTPLLFTPGNDMYFRVRGYSLGGTPGPYSAATEAGGGVAQELMRTSELCAPWPGMVTRPPSSRGSLEGAGKEEGLFTRSDQESKNLLV
eukprot:TRINITY_DN8457_c0_g1_i1.p1 TRINITY_DN8457_c0_g1~~TRINITY_DN8457_c0_g1_i1.p1  ORF type:complete len:530 (-),score=56.78 TRINITY_DN8457_c0_g1_i1:37-1626(-)